MCGTCHAQEDPSFPSSLRLGEACADCHAAPEVVDDEAAAPFARPLRASAAVRGGGPAALGPEIERLARETLSGRTDPAAAGEPARELRLAVRAEAVPEGRFVPAGFEVWRAEIEATVSDPTGAEAPARIRALSRPEYGRTADEAARAAALDAWAVLERRLVRELAGR